MQVDWRERFADTPDVIKGAQRQRTTVPVLDFEIGGGEFITMAGPCSVESEFQLLATANHVRRSGARILRGGAFKPRSSPYSFQGLGLEGLKMLARAREESGLAIVTEVMSETDVPMVADYADILQIGTRNMENYARETERTLELFVMQPSVIEAMENLERVFKQSGLKSLAMAAAFSTVLMEGSGSTPSKILHSMLATFSSVTTSSASPSLVMLVSVTMKARLPLIVFRY